MTRENKLALVVGFALILVVGILISDHFSTARSQRSAELGQVIDPTHPNTYANSQLIEFDAGPRPQPLLQPSLVDRSAAFNTTHDAVRNPQGLANVRDPLADRPRHTGSPGQSIQLKPAAIDTLLFTFHHVKKNENLTSICQQYFGDATLVSELAAYNNITDMNLVPLGMRLRIPQTSALIRGDTAARQTRSAPATPAPLLTAKTYTVRKGDTLGEIALQVLGTSRKWRRLYELNRDVIANPDRVIEGTVLKIPTP